MKIRLPELPYSFDALEPLISKTTVETHYTKHHQKYVDRANELIKNTKFEGMEDLEEIILSAHGSKADQELFNNASQVYNHNFYWNTLNPERKHMAPSADLTDKLSETFKSFKDFNDQFRDAAVKLFGSGWVWLVREDDGKLAIISLKDGETPLLDGRTPLLACDVWEHAYYLDTKNDRKAYFEHFWKLIDWKFVENNLNQNNLNPEGRALLSRDIMEGLSGNLYPGFA